MADPQKTVFISYRRSVSWAHSRLIFDHLRTQGYDVFIDVESIQSGQMETIIFNQIAARAHFLIVLTAGTVNRFAEPNDLVRREIELAMRLKRNIVPILVDNFSFIENSQFLSGVLADLSQYAGVPLSHDYFEASMERLRTRFLEHTADVMIQPAPPAESSEVEQRIEEAASAPPPTEQQLTAEQYFERAFARDEADLEGRIADWTETIRLDPSSSESYFNRGVTGSRIGDLEGAIEDYSTALALSPTNADISNNRGEALFAQGDFAAALRDFAKALAVAPGNRFALPGYTVTLHALGRTDEAKQLWQQLIDSDPRYCDADWVGRAMNWAPPLIEEARKLIAILD
jgi:tetratricopeptide (TPR) repeat protein